MTPLSYLYAILNFFLRAIVVFSPFLLVVHCIKRRRDVRRIRENARNGALSHLRHFFPEVPADFTPSGFHQFKAWVTGRQNHPGLNVRFFAGRTARRIPYDFLWTRYSILTFEFLFRANPRAAFSLHIQSTPPRFSDEMALVSSAVEDTALKCFSDLDYCLDLFLLDLNSFMEAHPKVLRLAALTDLNQFEGRGISRYVVRLEFTFDAIAEDLVLWREIVELGMCLADTYSRLALPGEVMEPIQQRRIAILKRIEQEKKTDVN
jgi:hypothetical protein